MPCVDVCVYMSIVWNDGNGDGGYSGESSMRTKWKIICYIINLKLGHGGNANGEVERFENAQCSMYPAAI